MTQTIKLMADYGGTVLWRMDGDKAGPIEPDSLDSLPIPVDLQKALQQWASQYDATLNHDYPPNSGFASTEEEEAFELEGRRLWASLKLALKADEWTVVYFSSLEGRLLT